MVDEPGGWRGAAQRWRCSPATIPICVALASLGIFLAVPLYAGPDEGPHVTRAASVVRGQLAGEDRRIDSAIGKLTLTYFDLPAEFGNAPDRTCFLGDTNITPACMVDAGRASTNTVELGTYMGHNPVGYYVIVGLATLLAVGDAGVLGMHLIGWLVLVASVACSWWLRTRVSPTSRLGAVLGFDTATALALTPTALLLNVVANPNGGEVAFALVAWTGALNWAFTRPGPGRNVNATAFAVSGALLCFTRPLSVVWFVLIAAVSLVINASGSGEWSARRTLSQRCRLVFSGVAEVPLAARVVSLVAVVTACAWTLVRRPATAWQLEAFADMTRSDVLAQSAKNYPGVIRSMFSHMFIWDSGPGILPTLFWLAAYALIVSGIWRGRQALGLRTDTTTRAVAAISALLAVTIVMMPIVGDVVGARTAGYFWDGRYSLPLLIGLPLLLTSLPIAGSRRLGPTSRAAPGSLSDTRAAVTFIRRAVSVLVSSGTVFATMWLGRRYAVGLDGPWLYFLDPEWGSQARWLTSIAASIASAALLVGRMWMPVHDTPEWAA